MTEWWIAGTVLLILAGSLFVAIWDATSPSIVLRNPAKGPVLTGFSNRMLKTGEMRRGYWLYVPTGYQPGQPIPLVLSLHGFASNPKGQRYLSHWDELAERETFIVVFPQGTGMPLRWNASDDFGVGHIDDVAFFRLLLDELTTLLDIDPKRIYVNGMSNGGAMTARLACELADVIAAIGIVAGPPIQLEGSCRPVRPIPLIAFYGTADLLVKYQGGAIRSWGLHRWLQMPAPRVTFGPVPPWIESWAVRNGCEPVLETLPSRGDTSGVRYSGCQAGAEVIFYTIAGGGHAWPGGSPTPFVKTSRSINATAEMWAFFQAHPLPAR